MSKFSSARARRLLLLVGVIVPCGLFFWARAAVSWRPHLVARQSRVEVGPMLGTHFPHLSPDGKWLVSEDDYQKTSTLWNLSDAQQKRTISGTQAVFSPDSRLIATGNFEEEKLYLNDLSRLLWNRKLPRWDYDPPVNFVSNSTALQYHDAGPYIEGSTVTLATKDGRVLGKKIIEFSPWEVGSELPANADESRISDYPTKVSFYSKNSDEPVYSFELSNNMDQWDVAPDQKHLWASCAQQHKVDIRDVHTGRVLWSYSGEIGGYDSGGTPSDLYCYPSWENGGKTLATIENDTLILRDAQTGKVLLQHKNNLPSPLKSWAFTKDGNAVYLMDQTGKIYRQRLH